MLANHVPFPPQAVNGAKRFTREIMASITMRELLNRPEDVIELSAESARDLVALIRSLPMSPVPGANRTSEDAGEDAGEIVGARGVRRADGGRDWTILRREPRDEHGGHSGAAG